MSSESEQPLWAEKREFPEGGEDLGLTIDSREVFRLMWVTDDSEVQTHGVRVEVVHWSGHPHLTFPLMLQAVLYDVEFEDPTFDPTDPRYDADDEIGDTPGTLVRKRLFKFTDAEAARRFAEGIRLAADEFERIQAETT
jgi:hypothetical protein